MLWLRSTDSFKPCIDCVGLSSMTPETPQMCPASCVFLWWVDGFLLRYRLCECAQLTPNCVTFAFAVLSIIYVMFSACFPVASHHIIVVFCSTFATDSVLCFSSWCAPHAPYGHIQTNISRTLKNTGSSLISKRQQHAAEGSGSQCKQVWGNPGSTSAPAQINYMQLQIPCAMTRSHVNLANIETVEQMVSDMRTFQFQFCLKACINCCAMSLCRIRLPTGLPGLYFFLLICTLRQHTHTTPPLV